MLIERHKRIAHSQTVRDYTQEQMCLLLREAMNVGRIALSEYFFSTELGDREARQRIKDELSSYCVVNEAPKTTFGKFRKTYTGKLYGTASCNYTACSFSECVPLSCSGKQDDLCIALQLAMIGCQKVVRNSSNYDTHVHSRHSSSHTQFFQDPKYKSFRPDDYHTPLGLANNPQPRGVV